MLTRLRRPSILLITPHTISSRNRYREEFYLSPSVPYCVPSSVYLRIPLSLLQREVELELIESHHHHRVGAAAGAPLPLPHSYSPPALTQVTTPPPIFLSETRNSQLEMIQSRTRRAASNVHTLRRPRSNRWRGTPPIPPTTYPGFLLHFL